MDDWENERVRRLRGKLPGPAWDKKDEGNITMSTTAVAVPQDETLTPGMAATIRAFLNYSFTGIGGEYNQLTCREQELVTKLEFDRLVGWVRREP